MFPETSVTRNSAVCLNRTEISVRLHKDIHDRSPMPLLIVSYCIKHCILWICRIWTILHNLIEMSITVLTLTYISYYIYISQHIQYTQSPASPKRFRSFRLNFASGRVWGRWAKRWWQRCATSGHHLGGPWIPWRRPIWMAFNGGWMGFLMVV